MAWVQGIEVLTSLEERVAPAHTALLVVDMQNDYCAPGGAADREGRDIRPAQAMVPRLRALVDAAREVQVPVLWAQYTLGPGSAGLSGPELLRRGHNFRGAAATIKGTWGHAIMDGLGYRPNEDLAFEKRRLSCFVGTELDLYLRSRGIKTLVVTGVVTQGCVETTVRDAACYDYYVAVVADCVASTRWEWHERALANMATFLRYDDAVVTAERLRAIWAGAIPAPPPPPAPEAVR
jgi:nicotinamidase-related amidase